MFANSRIRTALSNGFVCGSIVLPLRSSFVGAPTNDEQKEEKYRCEHLRAVIRICPANRNMMAGGRLYHLYPSMYPEMIDIHESHVIMGILPHGTITYSTAGLAETKEYKQGIATARPPGSPGASFCAP